MIQWITVIYFNQREAREIVTHGYFLQQYQELWIYPYELFAITLWIFHADSRILQIWVKHSYCFPWKNSIVSTFISPLLNDVPWKIPGIKISLSHPCLLHTYCSRFWDTFPNLTIVHLIILYTNFEFLRSIVYHPYLIWISCGGSHAICHVC